MPENLEEFFKRKGVPADHVLDPKRVSDEYEREKLQKDIELEKKKNAARTDGAIDVSGYMKDEKVVKKTEEPKAPEAPKKSLRETLNIPQYNPQAAPAAAPQTPPSMGMQKEQGFPWDRALIGATPLLVGLLTGNKLEGVQTSADYLVKGEAKLYQNEQDLASKLAQMKAKRDTASGHAGSRRYQSQTIALSDGTNVKGVFDTFTGKHLMPDGQEIPSNFIRAGYAVNPEEHDRRVEVKSEAKRSDADYLGAGAKVDPVTGELAIVRNGIAQPVQGSPAGKFNKKQEADITGGIKELKDSDAYKDSVQALSLTPQVNSLLDAAGRANDPNSIAGSSVVLTMIRQAQRVGVASDRDASAFGGTQQYLETINRLEEKLLGSGKPFTQRDLNDLREVSSIYTRVAKKRLGGYYADKKNSFASRFNIDPALIDEQMGTEVRPYMDAEETQIKAANAPVKVKGSDGRTWTSTARDKSMAIEMDGVVNFADPKDWEEIKRRYPKAKRLN